MTTTAMVEWARGLPYTKRVVTDQELADIYAYLQSIPQPPPAKSIPILNK